METDKKINELLNKYWNCETSLEEEQQLRVYFQRREIPKQWEETAALFRYFEEHKNMSLPDASFDSRVMQKVKTTKTGGAVRYLNNALRIAAGIAVLLTATWLVRNEIREATPQQQIADTYTDPKVALEETKKALLMISKSFGAATDEARKINMFNEAREKIQYKQETKTEL